MTRRFLLTAALATLAGTAGAQTVSSFDALPLTGSDTEYVNFTMPGKDVGFNDGLVRFPCVFDTGGGFSYWSGGFTYSNETDTATGNYIVQYNAKPGKGVGLSQKYGIFFEPYDHKSFPHLRLTGAAAGKAVRGMYVTNTTYAYNVMKDGDFLAGPRFGDTSANDTSHARPDFFKLTVRGYLHDTLKADSVEFYLADFRSPSKANDYIVRDWKWLPLQGLGKVDSLDFFLTSSRNNSFGNLVPAYFALDNFTTDEGGLSVPNAITAAVRVYPNPATDHLVIEDRSGELQVITVLGSAGNVVAETAAAGAQTELNTSGWAAGIYLVRLKGTSGVASLRIVKN